MKSLDRKLSKIHDGSYKAEDFILADAKDSDMALGVAAAGAAAAGGYRTRPSHVGAMEELVLAEAVDIMLTSVANGERLASRGIFADGPVTLAIRANDTTDIWLPRGATYSAEPSRPFRSASLRHVRPFCDLGLYSITFNNQLDTDYASLEAYARFREEAQAVGLRHFLEVFNPNAPVGLSPDDMNSFLNDSIVRTLAGLTTAERPLFLKIPYNGPRALSELVSHDPSLVVGILGGLAGTTRDTFELLAQGARHGARVALFGRKIGLAESPIDIVAGMWRVVRGEVKPAEAVREYHAALEKKGVKPKRSLEVDVQVTEHNLRLE